VHRERRNTKIWYKHKLRTINLLLHWLFIYTLFNNAFSATQII
jgi:hypothetical protein